MNRIERQRKTRHQNRDFAKSLLGGKCVICGELYNLEFDHIDPKSKTYTISRLLSSARSILIKELQKCQLLCKRCHRLKSIRDTGKIPASEQHGTLTSYTRGRCRCDECREFWNNKTKEYKRKIRGEVAQLVVASVWRAEGCQFDTDSRHQVRFCQSAPIRL